MDLEVFSTQRKIYIVLGRFIRVYFYRYVTRSHSRPVTELVKKFRLQNIDLAKINCLSKASTVI